MQPLATQSDLSARSITIEPVARRDAALRSASAAVREAAGCPINAVTTTVTVAGGRSSWLDLPGPIVSVDSITSGGQPITGWKVRQGRLWNSRGWHDTDRDFTVTYTFGRSIVDEDIIDLVCSLAAASAAAAEDGYESTRGLTGLSIDDYTENYTRGDAEILSPVELPKRTRDWLRNRFSGCATVIGTY